MIRHIFCDLDGTLYNKGINEEDVKAIRNIENEGVIFHVATGRVFKQAYKMVSEKFKLNGYYICENGSFIYDKDKNLIAKNTLDDNLVRKIINTFDSNTSHIYLKYDGDVVLSGGAEIFDFYSSDYIVDEELFKGNDFKNLVGNVGILSDDMNDLKRLEYFYKDEFRDICDTYISGPYTLNIVPSHVSKRKAIESVCEKYNVTLDEIATLGDSPNDICMLENMKYSFAMTSGKDEVKKSASYVVGSVKDAIDMIRKINRTKK